MNCNDCKSALPDLLLGAPEGAKPRVTESIAAARAHVESCAGCARELEELEATFALLEEWEAPAVSPYFDQKMAVRLREAQEAAPESWLERMRSRLLFNTGRQLRPVMAGALGLVLAVGGGAYGVSALMNQPVEDSHVVRDLKSLDQNEKALQQMDQLLQEEANDQAPPVPVPQS